MFSRIKVQQIGFKGVNMGSEFFFFIIFMLLYIILISTRLKTIMPRIEKIKILLSVINSDSEFEICEDEVEWHSTLPAYSLDWIRTAGTSIKYISFTKDDNSIEIIDIYSDEIPSGLVIYYTNGPAIKTGSFGQYTKISNHKLRYQAGILKGKILKKIEEVKNLG